MYTIPSLPKTMRDALPDGIAEKMSCTSTNALPSHRPRASVIVAGAFAAAGGVLPAALPPRPPAAAASTPRPSVRGPQRPVGARVFAPVLAEAGLWYVR